MNKLSSTLAGILLTAVAALSLPAAAATSDSVIHVKNKSDWEIHHLFISPTNKDDWGPDQLGKQVIPVGGSFELHKVPCGTWDVRLVDEDGDECILYSADICASKEAWVITNDALLGCESDGD
jgi:hypothetical protein